MKAILLLLLALLPLSAQPDLAKLLAAGMKGAVAGLEPQAVFGASRAKASAIHDAVRGAAA